MGSSFGKILLIGGLVSAAVAIGCFTMGFGIAGIIGGSAAAAIQSSIGSVAAGSIFATVQSLGATGVIAGTAIGGASAAAVGAGILIKKDCK